MKTVIALLSIFISFALLCNQALATKVKLTGSVYNSQQSTPMTSVKRVWIGDTLDNQDACKQFCRLHRSWRCQTIQKVVGKASYAQVTCYGE
ncbi:UNKNOWN [Stylonychia lemnae]|uniref:Apple domain-containing protein n=1 Tax=Stylonychia lemnae TaxID=5949 RepID=A0A078A448_STYLE|nr:UNKNOWN [Stylonychia lemnae]|eukprot:CDW76917.1 UNKNOWN [Stylonychia lemnae]